MGDIIKKEYINAIGNQFNNFFIETSRKES